MPICDQGCGWQYVLIITGEQRGTIWTAGEEGWLPAFNDEQHTQKNLLEWYQNWLDSALSSF